ncbi:MAG: hypothetical protein QF511_09780 [Rhodospirillales bacterium]|jgi:hypothetical protein|nr:hypothetical protein [Rhodospirillales bacterium]HIJ46005.1 hypothetical protein [Rhodospirillaceae bacterium]MDP7098779.1 hypothetical protein [Rhodospirillales bacterium]MDP7215522.1 hypothetical protein [Rhodospirillales bacterium]HIJ92206.1 hypothetical protein [Rhodospirillaceae bacterium]
MKEAINEHVWGMARGAKAVAMRKRKIIREDSMPSLLIHAEANVRQGMDGR